MEKSLALLDENATALQGDLEWIVRNAQITRALAASTPALGQFVQPGLTWLLLMSAIAVAISDDTSVMLPGTIIVLLVLASAW